MVDRRVGEMVADGGLEMVEDSAVVWAPFLRLVPASVTGYFG